MEAWNKSTPNIEELEAQHLQVLGTVLSRRPELKDFEVAVHKSRIIIQAKGHTHPASIYFRYSRSSWVSSRQSCEGIQLSSDGSYSWNVNNLTRNYKYDFANGSLPSIDKLVTAVTKHLTHLGELTTQQQTREHGIQEYADALVAVLKAADFIVVRRGDRHDVTLEVAGLSFTVQPSYAYTSYGRTGLSVTTHNIVAVLQAWATVKAAMAEKE